MAEIATTIREVRPETAAAVTLRLEPEGAIFTYRPGQYVTIDAHQFDAILPEIRVVEAARGKPVRPTPFSLSSDALDPRFIEVTVKLPRTIPLPPLSSFLVREARPGQSIRIQGPAGRYALPEAPPPGITGFLHLCAGSGVAPNRGMIRHALGRGWPQRHLLLLQDRTEADGLFRGEWLELAARHPGSFRMRHVIGGHISEEIIRREAQGFLDLSRAWAFVCGPNGPRPEGAGFVDRWRELPGFSPDRIITEQG